MHKQQKKVVLLGATGSVGKHTLEVLRCHPQHFQLVGAMAYRQHEALFAIAEEFKVANLVLLDESVSVVAIRSKPSCCKNFGFGKEALKALAALPEADIIVVATNGVSALEPTLAALQMGKTVALANKETLVMGGKWVMAAAKAHGATLLPVDSEHNALFQCLQSHAITDVQKVILTASGGAFRNYNYQQMQSITPQQATQHPNWRMGKKITVDTSTLANKGLELMEARWLFDLTPQQLDVVVHLESVVHGLVQFKDGSVISQWNPPSMVFPIHHCLFYPQRIANSVPSVDFTKTFSLNFQVPDYQRFPCLKLAFDVVHSERCSQAIIYNAANEEAVEAFLGGSLAFLDIARQIEWALDTVDVPEPNTLKEAIDLDFDVRLRVRKNL